MFWFNFFDNKTTQLRHPFGRGINASISPQEEELFNKSQVAFENKDILDAYEYFFNSLENFTNNISNKNIIIKREDKKLNFEIFQGCAKVSGYITQEHIYAEAIITKLSSANVALKRYILEKNYQLTYAYYFTDNEYIKLKLYHNNITMTPQKIFFPLREIALNSDFDKEYIITEFNIELEEISHIKEVDKDELEIKYNFLQKLNQDINDKIAILPSNDNSGMQAFILLNAMFMLDYLLVPKYRIYQKSSKKIQEYFNDETTSIESKNNEIRDYINELSEMNFETFSKNFYNAKYTFNPTDKTEKENMDNFINESLLKIRWYKNNRYHHIIPTIYKYIAFYILYNYGLNPVLKDLFHILVEIQNSKFFKSLKYEELYNEDTSIFNEKLIISKIDNSINTHQDRFKSLQSFTKELNFSSLNEFSNSYYQQIQNLNFEEI